MELESEKKANARLVIRKNINRDGTVTKPISMVQRHLKLGYSEAKSIVETLKKEGVFND